MNQTLHFIPEMIKQMLTLNVKNPELKDFLKNWKANIAYQIEGIEPFSICFEGGEQFDICLGEGDPVDCVIKTTSDVYMKIIGGYTDFQKEIQSGNIQVQGIEIFKKYSRLLITDQKVSSLRNKILLLMKDYNIANMIHVGLELGLFKYLAENPQGVTDQEIAKALGFVREPVEIWCKTALAEEFLVFHEDGRYQLAPYLDILFCDEDSRYYSGYGGGAIINHMYFASQSVKYPEVFKKGLHYALKDQGQDAAEKANGATNFMPLLINSQIIPQIPDLETQLKKGARILDVGSGFGDNVILNGTMFPDCQIIGIDNDESVNAKTVQRIEMLGLEDKIAIQKQDILAMDFHEEFDFVELIFTLHEIPLENQQQVIKKCYDSLRPGGYILIFEDIYPEADETQDECFQFSIMHQWYELFMGSKILSRKEKERILGAAGFDRIETIYLKKYPKFFQKSIVGIVGKK